MQKIFKKFLITIRVVNRCSHNGGFDLTKGFIDPKTKVIYGGDLHIPVSDKSAGRILFNRMLQMDRREEIFQISSSSHIAMTTRECLENSVALAEKLKESGIRKGDFVFLLGHNSLIMNISLLGIVFSGAVPVPLSCNIDLSEFEIIMKSLKPKFFGCEGKYLYLFRKALNALPDFDNSKIFLLDKETEANESGIASFADFVQGRGKNFESFQPSEVENAGEELFFGIKTVSNGPGARVVGITHRNTNNFIAQYDSVDEGSSLRNEIILMVKKFFWTTGLYPLLLSSCYGSKLIVMESFDEEQFLKVINDYKVTTTFLFSSKCWRIFKHTPKGQYDLSSCKKIYSEDGFLPETLIHGWQEKFGIVLRPGYAINEITGFALKPVEGFLKPESSGKLVTNLYGKVISKTSENLGPNEIGEICFKGPSVTNGFINDDEATKLLFDEEGFLLTGHYGYYDEDGDFFIVDGVVHQIKYKNHKVSPREIEGIIKTFEPVKEVCVAGIPHLEDGEHVIAFVELEENSKVTEDEIQNFVNSQVPDHKKVRAVVILSKIPKHRRTGTIKRSLFAYILSKYRVKVDTSKD